MAIMEKLNRVKSKMDRVKSKVDRLEAILKEFCSVVRATLERTEKKLLKC